MKTNIQLLLSRTILLIIVLSTHALSEKDTPICFRHKETQAIVRPCQTFKSDNDAYTRIYCMDGDETMQPFKPTNMDDWERLEGDICVPVIIDEDVPRKMKTNEIEKNTIKNNKNNQKSSERKHWNKLVQELGQLSKNDKYSQQTELAQKIYQYAEQNFGKIDKDTLESLNILALLYKSQERYSEAEPLFKRCLKLREEVLGIKHPDTIDSVGCLAILYHSQLKYTEAEPLYKRFLELRENFLGEKHPHTLAAMNNLAGLYKDMKRFHEAESLYKRVLKLSEEVQGEKHSDTLSIINNLALLYSSCGRYREAETLFKHSLQLHEEVLGTKHSDTLNIINNIASLYKYQSRYSKAESLYNRCLKLSEDILGEKHLFTITIICNLAELYKFQGKYSEAEQFFNRCYSLRNEVLGLKHPDTIRSIYNIAVLYDSQGRYYEAKDLYMRSFLICEEVFGLKHPLTVSILREYVGVYTSLGKYSKAEQLYKGCLKLSEIVFGPKHPDTLLCINDLAVLYDTLRNFPKAERLYKRCIKLSEEVLGEKHPKTLSTIGNLANLYSSQWKYSEAERLYKRCIKHKEELLGPNHPDTLINLNNLASLYDSQQRYPEAESLYKRCIKLREEILGPKHPKTLISLNNLAELYRKQGRYPEAEPLFKRCLKMSAEILGEKHPDTLAFINNLAVLYNYHGRYLEAEPMFKRCLELREEILGPKHPDTLNSINNLAGYYHSHKMYAEALPLYKRCLKLSEEVLGAKHTDTLICINNLGVLYSSLGKYSKAEPLLKRCLELREEVSGPKHPSTLLILNNLGRLYDLQGRYPKAVQVYKRCLELREEALGTKHQDTIVTMTNYATCLFLINHKKKAIDYFKKVERSLLNYSAYILQSTKKLRVRRQFMMSKSNYQSLLLDLAFQSNHPEMKAFASDIILRWKGIQQEAETIMNYIIHSTKDPNILQLGQNINDLRRQMNTYDERIDLYTLTKQLEEKENELARLSNAYQHYLNKPFRKMNDLKQKLSSKTAIIELKQYHHFNYNTRQLEEKHLAALLILPNTQTIILEDLGSVKDIEFLLEAIRTEKNQKARKSASKKLYTRLFGAFDKHIKQATTIYISPDGITHKIAFSRLILQDGRFWIERQNLCSIQTSRDLLNSNKPINQGTLVAMGGIDYNQFPDIAVEQASKTSDDYGYKRTIKRTAETVETFNSLRFSKLEIENIKMFYQLSQQKAPLIFHGTSACEYQLKHLKSPPHILHLATHGFYLEKKEAVTERPMLLSGLALAGCNLGLKGKKGPVNEDGILYAIEVAGLDLTGTELVVLSACDTGKGTIDYSEGVYGLLRAFRLAGAQNIMMTLWSLQDKSASEFLTCFYKTWLSKSNMTPLKALRQTQISFIKQNKDSELWAPYVMVGGELQ